jgi:hypothetical protein
MKPAGACTHSADTAELQVSIGTALTPFAHPRKAPESLPSFRNNFEIGSFQFFRRPGE